MYSSGVSGVVPSVLGGGDGDGGVLRWLKSSLRSHFSAMRRVLSQASGMSLKISRISAGLLRSSSREYFRRVSSAIVRPMLMQHRASWAS